MAYIIFVNPAILAKTGMPIAAVTAATCLCAALGSILMGVLARYPLALAPGMGLNAYFTYTVCLKMHVPWQTALGAVFLSGAIFLLLTLGGVRQLLVGAIPKELHAAVAGGIGLFIAFVGLIESGIIVKDPSTAVTSTTEPHLLCRRDSNPCRITYRHEYRLLLRGVFGRRCRRWAHGGTGDRDRALLFCRIICRAMGGPNPLVRNSTGADHCGCPHAWCGGGDRVG